MTLCCVLLPCVTVQSDVVHQSVYELIHTDDRGMFREQLHFALNPKLYAAEQGGDGMLNSGPFPSSPTTTHISYHRVASSLSAKKTLCI